MYTLLHNQFGVCGTGEDGIYDKEAHFFDQPHLDFNSSSVISTYQHRFNGTGCSHYIDATPNHLLDFRAPHHMMSMPAAWLASVKMVAILREPISRDLSIFNM